MMIRIKNLRVKTIIGTGAEERQKPQEIILNLQLNMEKTRACLTDEISDTVDYESLKDRVIDLVKGSQYYLIERLAEKITELVMREKYVSGVKVEIDKPEALNECDSVSVVLETTKK